jgi:hypothetical protein
LAIVVNYLCQDEPGWTRPVMRLHQSFYESAHLLVDDKRAGPFLHRILTMGYGGNVLVDVDRLRDLMIELDGLQSSIGVLAQLEELRTTVQLALEQEKALVFFGDMYPELDKKLRHDRSLPDLIDCKRCGKRNKSPFWDVCLDCGHVRAGNAPT